jgi:hypothetical protein
MPDSMSPSFSDTFVVHFTARRIPRYHCSGGIDVCGIESASDLNASIAHQKQFVPDRIQHSPRFRVRRPHAFFSECHFIRQILDLDQVWCDAHAFMPFLERKRDINEFSA